jgi:hypothetical protein
VRHRNFCARSAAFRPSQSKTDLLGAAARGPAAQGSIVSDALQPYFAALKFAALISGKTLKSDLTRNLVDPNMNEKRVEFPIRKSAG